MFPLVKVPLRYIYWHLLANIPEPGATACSVKKCALFKKLKFRSVL